MIEVISSEHGLIAVGLMHSGEYHIGIRRLGEIRSLTTYPMAKILVVQSFTDIVDFLST